MNAATAATLLVDRDNWPKLEDLVAGSAAGRHVRVQQCGRVTAIQG